MQRTGASREERSKPDVIAIDRSNSEFVPHEIMASARFQKSLGDASCAILQQGKLSHDDLRYLGRTYMADGRIATLDYSSAPEKKKGSGLKQLQLCYGFVQSSSPRMFVRATSRSDLI